METGPEDEPRFELEEAKRRTRSAWEEETIAMLYLTYELENIPLPEGIHHREGEFTETVVKLLSSLPQDLRRAFFKEHPSLITPYALHTARKRISSLF